MKKIILMDLDNTLADYSGAGPSEELKQWKTEAQEKSTPFEQAYLKVADEMIALAEQATEMLEASCYMKWVEEIGQYGYMCHQDYGSGNALQTDKGVYVLDLDNVAYDIPLRDVRKLITKRMEEIEGEWEQAELEKLLNSYESILPLSDEQQKLLAVALRRI